MDAVVRVPGTCGELVQGMINGKEFLVSCPISVYSQISLRLSKKNKEIKINDYYRKSKKALKETLKYYKKEEYGAIVKIKTDLIPAKGMGSSTADITGVTAAVMQALHGKLDFSIIKKIAVDIEPSDSSFLPGINEFSHKTGKKQIYLGEPPAIDIIIFSERGTINTIEYNQKFQLKKFKRQKQTDIKKALNLLKKGIKNGDKKLIGKATTISSLAHQKIIYKPHLEKIIEIVSGVKGVFGVNIAHSGTLIGILVEPQFSWIDLIKKIKARCPALEYHGNSRLISGGIEIK